MHICARTMYVGRNALAFLSLSPYKAPKVVPVISLKNAGHYTRAVARLT
jgi:hypothetical protein